MARFREEGQPVRDVARGRGAEREGTSAEESSVSAKGRSRRRWCDEDMARVVGERMRPGDRMIEGWLLDQMPVWLQDLSVSV